MDLFVVFLRMDYKHINKVSIKHIEVKKITKITLNHIFLNKMKSI
jgi:hypothetical protein